MVIRRVCGIVGTVYLALILEDGDDFSCGWSGEKICRLGGSRLCVFVNVGVRHRRQVGQVQGSSSQSQQ